MKPSYLKLLDVIVIFIIVFTSCKKNTPVLPVDDAKIITNPVTVYTDGGITLNGTVKKIPSGLTEYGFLVSRDSLFISQQKFPITTPITVGTFSIDLSGGLQKNTKYFAATYSITSSSLTINRYNAVAFNYLGAKKPAVTSISPLKADMGDTITIKGKYFREQQNLTVFFDNQQAKVSTYNDSVLRCVVPVTLTQAAPAILFKYDNIPDTISHQFSLNTPIITNFTTLATFRDTITISGDHFGYQNSLNQVSIGGVTAAVVNSSRKQIKILVPDNVPHSFNDISIKAQAQTVVSTTKFQIKKPVITSVSSAININDVVTITGKYFHPEFANNIISSENNLAKLNSGNTTQLTYNIPYGVYTQRKVTTITLKLLDYNVTYHIDMSIKDKWVAVGKVPFYDYITGGAFTINNISYVISPQNASNYQYYIWKLNTSDFSWQKINIPFPCTHAQVISNGSKAYVYTFSATNNFYEYDANNNTWTEKADYPVTEIRRSGTMFAIGTKVYFGLGYSDPSMMGSQYADNSFYEYNPGTNSWRRIPDYPDPPGYGSRLRASTFVINNIGYVGCGSTNSGMFSFYSYSQASDSWQRIHDFPYTRSGASGFAFGNYGFVAAGGENGRTSTHDYFKYDPNADTWAHITTGLGCNSCAWYIDGGYVFINNGKVYMGGGDSNGSTNYLNEAVGSSL